MLATLLKSKDILKNPLYKLSTYLNGLKIQTVSKINCIITQILLKTDLNVSNSRRRVAWSCKQSFVCLL